MSTSFSKFVSKVGDAASATKSKVVSAISTKPKTADVVFDDQRRRWESLAESFQNLFKFMVRQDDAIKSLAGPMLSLAESLKAFYDTDADSNKLVRHFYMASLSVETAIREHNARHSEYRTVLEITLQTTVPQLRNRISERDSALVKLEKATEELQSLQEKRETLKIPEAEQRYEQRKAIYEDLNRKVLDELQDFNSNKFVILDQNIGLIISEQALLFKAIDESYQIVREPVDSNAGIITPNKRNTPLPTPSTFSSVTGGGLYPAPQAVPLAYPNNPNPNPNPQYNAYPNPTPSAPPLYQQPPQPTYPQPSAPVVNTTKAPPPRPPPKTLEQAMGRAAGDAVSNAALNEENQEKAGKMVASQASDPETQARLGQQLASNTSNPLLKGLATNSSVQGFAGRGVSSVAQNKAVQQHVRQIDGPLFFTKTIGLRGF
eukprot:TRINITY_DN3387_c0_g2_i1.p1 TRINITY_DN3387_c0_g2~~TRINITY_DN3387_c0_g2_i1.p1  ORF type:complete len:433 (-),score=110.83 TRINITY_DN3387_c0_g2_i1:57-1355(-)